MEWRLKQRLRIAVLGVPLAFGACKKEPRHAVDQPVTIDAAVVVKEPVADAAIAEVPVDAAVTAAVAKVKPPRPTRCSTGSWCAPAEQVAAMKLASVRSVDGCRTSVRVSRDGRLFSLDLSRSRTE